MIGIVIILVLAALVLFIAGTAYSRQGAKMLADKDNAYKKEEGKSSVNIGRKLKFIAFVPFLIALVAVFFSSVRIVDSTEVGVVRNFGQISRTIDGGFNLVNPITETVTMYDLKVHVKEADFMSYSKDAQPLEAVCEYQYQIDPAFVMDIAQKYGSQEQMEGKLTNVVEERVKIVFARYSAMELIEARSTLSSEVDNEVTNVEELFHVTFTSVIVRDIDFSDAFEKSVEEKMIASQEVLKAEQEKEKAIIEAEKAKEVAEIKAEEARIAAQGEADALMITKEALEKMPANYTELQYLEKWDGKLPQIVSEGSGLMLTPNIGD